MAETKLLSATFGEGSLIVRTINGEMQVILSQGPGMEVQLGITEETADDALALFSAGISALKLEKSIDELHVAYGTLGVWEPTDGGYGNFTCLHGSGNNGIEFFHEGDTFECYETDKTIFDGMLPKKEKAPKAGGRGGKGAPEEMMAFSQD